MRTAGEQVCRAAGGERGEEGQEGKKHRDFRPSPRVIDPGSLAEDVGPDLECQPQDSRHQGRTSPPAERASPVEPQTGKGEDDRQFRQHEAAQQPDLPKGQDWQQKGQGQFRPPIRPGLALPATPQCVYRKGCPDWLGYSRLTDWGVPLTPSQMVSCVQYWRI